MNTAERQLDKLHAFLSDHVRPAGLTVSEFVTREAEAGNMAARRVLASGIFTGAGSDDPTPAPAPLAPNIIARENRIATQTLPAVRTTREPRRPVVASGQALWLK